MKRGRPRIFANGVQYQRIAVHEDIHKKILELAKDDGVSMANWIRLVVEPIYAARTNTSTETHSPTPSE